MCLSGIDYAYEELLLVDEQSACFPVDAGGFHDDCRGCRLQEVASEGV
jgi:hypothetical protein